MRVSKSLRLHNRGYRILGSILGPLLMEIATFGSNWVQAPRKELELVAGRHMVAPGNGVVLGSPGIYRQMEMWCGLGYKMTH